MIIKCGLAVLLLCAFAQCAIREVRPFVSLDMSISGGPVLKNAVNKQEADLKAAVDAMEPVDNECDQKGIDFKNQCSTCTTNKCNERRSSCPTLKSIVLTTVPNFFKSTGVSAAKNVRKTYNNFVGVGSRTIKVIGQEIREKYGQSARVAIQVGKEFQKVAEAALNFAKDAGKTIISFKNDAVNALKNVANTVKNTIIGAVGKRKRSLEHFKVKRASEPNCWELRTKGADACEYYANPPMCPTCVFNKETDCPGWKNANDRVKAQQAEARWLEDRKTDNKYAILKMKYDTRNYDPDTGAYKNVDVTASLFGRPYQFIVVEPVDLIAADEVSAGRIVSYAIAAAKLAKERGLA